MSRIGQQPVFSRAPFVLVPERSRQICDEAEDLAFAGLDGLLGDLKCGICMGKDGAGVKTSSDRLYHTQPSFVTSATPSMMTVLR